MKDVLFINSEDNHFPGIKEKDLGLIKWDIFFDAMRTAVGRRILIVDTCHSRNIAGDLDFHSLAKRSASSSFAVMASSHGNETSLEDPDQQHGLFTATLLKGLEGNADANQDNSIILEELFNYTHDIVVAVSRDEFSKHKNKDCGQKQQTPQLMAVDPLNLTTLGSY